MYNVGDKIIIRDLDNFYSGREATVVAKTDWSKVWAIMVKVAGAEVHMCIHVDKMEVAQ
jgi:hypothetical protein